MAIIRGDDVNADLARFTTAPAPQGDRGTHPGEREDRYVMKFAFKAQACRVLLALGALASSALVLEAGKRWS
jgi:hypothetical protein